MNPDIDFDLNQPRASFDEEMKELEQELPSTLTQIGLDVNESLSKFRTIQKASEVRRISVILDCLKKNKIQINSETFAHLIKGVQLPPKIAADTWTYEQDYTATLTDFALLDLLTKDNLELLQQYPIEVMTPFFAENSEDSRTVTVDEQKILTTNILESLRNELVPLQTRTALTIKENELKIKQLDQQYRAEYDKLDARITPDEKENIRAITQGSQDIQDEINALRRRIELLNEVIQAAAPSPFTQLWENFYNAFFAIFFGKLNDTIEREQVIEKYGSARTNLETLLPQFQSLTTLTEQRMALMKQSGELLAEEANHTDKVKSLLERLEPHTKINKTRVVMRMIKGGSEHEKQSNQCIINLATALKQFLENPTQETLNHLHQTMENNDDSSDAYENTHAFFALLEEANELYDIASGPAQSNQYKESIRQLREDSNEAPPIDGPKFD
ncbi:MAG: hypothetical protein P1U61_01665 [Legionellaceae bacterium]|nr:hypothetical protein [Legionellaceae bacterium]